MIVAKGKGKNGGDLVIIGLSEGNIEQLKMGRPAITEIPDSNTEVAIVYGKTEGDILRELKKGGIGMPIPEIQKGHGGKYS